MRNAKLEGQLGHAADAISDADTYIRDLEEKLLSAYEFMTGAWEPTDNDRRTYVESVAELLHIKGD